MTDAIGKGTARAKDLVERVRAIAGKRQIEKKLIAQVKDVRDDIKDLYASAKSAGYDQKKMKTVVAEALMSAVERQQHYQLEMDFGDELDAYRHALGLVDSDKDDPLDVASGHSACESGDTDATISVNGGPEHPISVVKEALHIVKGRSAPAKSKGGRSKADRYLKEQDERLSSQEPSTLVEAQ